MKILSVLLLALGGVCLSAPAAVSNITVPSAVQSLSAVAATTPFDDSVITQSHTLKRYSFEHRIGEDWKAGAVRDESSSPLTKNPVITTLDVPMEGPVRVAQDDYYHFDMSISEYCENAVLKARAWWSNGYKSFEITANEDTRNHLHLHAPTPDKLYDLVAGPYNFIQHYMEFQYGDCKWTTKGGPRCGYCVPQAWTLGPLNCETGAPGVQRLTYTPCYFKDINTNGQIAARDLQAVTTATPTPTADFLFEVASSTMTLELPTTYPTVHPPTPIADIIAEQASTITLLPAVIQTKSPTSPQAQNEIILPFHIQMWEYCLDGQRVAHGVYTNGNMKQSIYLKPGLMTSVNHRVLGYANLDIGSYDYKESKLRFHYFRNALMAPEDCVWYDNETWKSCGECRAGLWSAGPLDCRDPSALRIKDMDCSLLLGTTKADRQKQE